jgi:hypothetical protein
LAAFDVNKALADAAYVTVGFGLLGFQRAQVRRHELTKQFSALARSVDETVGPVRNDLDHQLDQLEERLPDQARTAVRSLRAYALIPEQLIRHAAGLEPRSGPSPSPAG